MRREILVLGGYGNFGKRIVELLARLHIHGIVAGRDGVKAEAVAARFAPYARPLACDANGALEAVLSREKPFAVIHTAGPFQQADYRVAEACIARGVHYIDLADGRDFVTGITGLHARAKAAGVAVISGASTVPALSSAVMEEMKAHFSRFDTLRFGISPGQQAERGLATTRAILTYTGKKLTPFAGHKNAYGWQNIHRQHYPGLGNRWMANCDIPDLDVLPAAYGLQSVRFSAGLELPFLHLGLWALSWGVRLKLPLNLRRFAAPLYRAAARFDRFGSADGGMHMIITGADHAGAPLTKTWFIIAKNGAGPYIPSVPSVLLARDLLAGRCAFRGAGACVGMVRLEEYTGVLRGLPVETFTI